MKAKCFHADLTTFLSKLTVVNYRWLTSCRSNFLAVNFIDLNFIDFEVSLN